MGLFDVHAHITHPRLLPRLEEVVANAEAAGLTTIISNGLNPADNEAVKAAAQRFDCVRAAYGFYPVDTVLPDMIAAGIDYPRDPGPLAGAEEGVAWVAEHAAEAFAIGEIGLDGYWVPQSFWEKQEEVFRQLVQIAIDHHKVIIVHSRKREVRVFEILEEMKPPTVLWHCFGSKVKLAKRIAQSERHFFSIPANARRAENFSRMLEKLPRERLLLETDCPYLGPERDADNEPCNVSTTVDLAAELWGQDRPSCLARFEGNFEDCFGVPP